MIRILSAQHKLTETYSEESTRSGIEKNSLMYNHTESKQGGFNTSNYP